MQVIGCGIHGFGEAIGIDVDEFRVFWKLDVADEHGKQVAYRIIVSESKVVDEHGLCFDSGRVESNEQRNILCNPRDGFKSTTPYYWTVTVWDQHGNEAISSVNEFYTSYPRSSRLLPPYSMNQTYVNTKHLHVPPCLEIADPDRCRTLVSYSALGLRTR